MGRHLSFPFILRRLPPERDVSDVVDLQVFLERPDHGVFADFLQCFRLRERVQFDEFPNLVPGDSSVSPYR